MTWKAGILALSIFLLACVDHMGETPRDIAKVQIAELQGALDLFKFDMGRYPTTKEGLKALIQDPGIDGWGGPYLKKEQVPADPWGRPYRYRCPGAHGEREYDLWSYGADGKAGGEGEDMDITSWH